jgi:hypothetical protein
VGVDAGLVFDRIRNSFWDPRHLSVIRELARLMD